jgi:DNA-binding winged helix-turn-helix (wHTH) protein
MTLPGPKPVYLFGGFRLDMRTRVLSQDDRELSLSPKEFLTLSLLVEAFGEAIQRETLVNAIWPDTVVGDTSLARNISSLRRYLGASAIEVVPKYGYRFALPVTLAAASLSSASEERAAASEGATQPHNPTSPLQDGPSRPGGQRRGAWIWAAAGVLAITVGVLTLRLSHLKNVTASDTGLTWTDPQTSLTWTVRDNGRNVTRQQAIDYCRTLDYAGHSDWRLPAIDELQTLYDSGISLPGKWGGYRPVYWHVKGNLSITGGESASDLEPETRQEQSYDFSFGRRNYDAADFYADHRALCMRPSAH